MGYLYKVVKQHVLSIGIHKKIFKLFCFNRFLVFNIYNFTSIYLWSLYLYVISLSCCGWQLRNFCSCFNCVWKSIWLFLSLFYVYLCQSLLSHLIQTCWESDVRCTSSPAVTYPGLCLSISKNFVILKKTQKKKWSNR